MNPAMTTVSRFTRSDYAGLGLVLTAAFLIRVHDLTTGGLWMDELWAATFVQLGIKDLLVAVIRLDLHPPFYYIQLRAWAALFGNTDTALLLNSVFWSLATLVAIHAATHRIIAPAAALPATILAAVAAGEVYYAQELRMYAMISALVVLCWLLADRYRCQRTWVRGIALVGLVALLAASHAASIVPVYCVMVYLLASLGIRDCFRPRNFCILALIGLSTIPALINSQFRGVSHMPVIRMEVVAETIAGWLFGYFPTLSPWIIPLGCIVVAASLIAGMTSHPARAMILSFIVWPVFFVLVISFLVRSIWIPRMMEFCSPFVCIAIAATAERAWNNSKTRSARIAAAVLAGGFVALMTLSSLRQGGEGRKMEYREAAEFLRSHVTPGAVVYIPEHVTFWGIARYFVGPDWGNALAIQDPIRPGRSVSWDPVYAKLGPDWLRWLNLLPEKRAVQADGVRLIIGWSPSHEVQDARTVWLVGSGNVLPDELALGDLSLKTQVQFRGVMIQELHQGVQ